MISRGIGKSAARSVARSLSQFGSGGGVAPSYDTDAQAYITAVEAADGQSLETGVKDAINAFVVGCKADGIWTAIKASCILAGARTLTGALVPLVGTAPTNNNFVSGDYSRTAGLTGDGSTKYLDSNRANNADPQDSKHISVYATAVSTGRGYAGESTAIGGTRIRLASAGSSDVTFAANGNQTIFSSANNVGLLAVQRSNLTQHVHRAGGISATVFAPSQVPSAELLDIFRVVTTYCDGTLAFYSIGESIDLALLDSRVTTLITSIGTAFA